jgi:2-oxoglutarate ferredoxin oxidoreductase subunit alpha
MNAAALKVNLKSIKKGGIIIANTDGFDSKNLRLANYPDDVNPLEDGSLEGYTVYKIDVTKLTREALAEQTGLGVKEKDRAKNMFVLGFLYWMYDRTMDNTIEFLQDKFGKKPEIFESNLKALKAGYNYGDTTEVFTARYKVAKAKVKPGVYRSITGNSALSLGLVTAAQKSGLNFFLGSYPITPASDILHDLSKYKNFNITTFQAEDEIAGIGAALGASYAGLLGVTTTSGPGVALKSEAIGLAVSLELPLIIVDVQRGGPSTGLPTKTEQADLLQAMFGRNGEAPVPIVAPQSPSDCFNAAIEAARIAITYRTPVFLLSDGYIANGAEPWRVPNPADLPQIEVKFADGPNHKLEDGTEVFWPFKRDPETLARPWAIPGVAGLEHRIGGIEKADGTGNISYDPTNHDFMVRTRQAKIDGIAKSISPLVVHDPSGSAKVLVIGWGSTYGPVEAACEEVRNQGVEVAHAHLRHLNPFPSNTGDVLKKYDKVLIPEMNLGQLGLLIRAKYLVDAIGFNQVRGLPFKTQELVDAIKDVVASV